MYFTHTNLNHTILKQPSKKDLARDSGLYEIQFDGHDMVTYMTPVDYRGLLIAERLRNVGMPTDFMVELEDYIRDYMNQEEAESEAGDDW